MQQFTCVQDVSSPMELVRSALSLKRQKFHSSMGEGKTLGLLFFNPSLRTRISTQKAAKNLGMDVLTINCHSETWAIEMEDGVVMSGNSVEHIKEAGQVLSQYFDVIGIRTFASLTDRQQDYSESILHQFIENTSIPVVSLETATLHPLQSLADLMTIEEHKLQAKPRIVLTWAPHVNPLSQAVANSLIDWIKITDFDFVIARPDKYRLSEFYEDRIPTFTDQDKALTAADFVYVKNWSSYENYGSIESKFPNWTVTAQKMNLTNSGKVMHCLPVRRNVVITDEVLDSSASLVIEQSNNRTYAAQAVLMEILRSSSNS